MTKLQRAKYDTGIQYSDTDTQIAQKNEPLVFNLLSIALENNTCHSLELIAGNGSPTDLAKNITRLSEALTQAKAKLGTTPSNLKSLIFGIDPTRNTIQDLYHLFSELKKHPHIQELIIESSTYWYSGQDPLDHLTPILRDCLPTSGLTSFGINNIKYNPEKWQGVIDAINTCPTIQKLDFCNCAIRDSAPTKQAEAIMRNLADSFYHHPNYSKMRLEYRHNGFYGENTAAFTKNAIGMAMTLDGKTTEELNEFVHSFTQAPGKVVPESEYTGMRHFTGEGNISVDQDEDSLLKEEHAKFDAYLLARQKQPQALRGATITCTENKDHIKITFSNRETYDAYLAYLEAQRQSGARLKTEGDTKPLRSILIEKHDGSYQVTIRNPFIKSRQPHSNQTKNEQIDFSYFFTDRSDMKLNNILNYSQQPQPANTYSMDRLAPTHPTTSTEQKFGTFKALKNEYTERLMMIFREFGLDTNDICFVRWRSKKEAGGLYSIRIICDSIPITNFIKQYLETADVSASPDSKWQAAPNRTLTIYEKKLGEFTEETLAALENRHEKSVLAVQNATPNYLAEVLREKIAYTRFKELYTQKLAQDRSGLLGMFRKSHMNFSQYPTIGAVERYAAHKPNSRTAHVLHQMEQEKSERNDQVDFSFKRYTKS